jgi:hypothetical protein
MASTTNDRLPFGLTSPRAQPALVAPPPQQGAARAQPAAAAPPPPAGHGPSHRATLVGLAVVFFMASNAAGIFYFGTRLSAQPVASTSAVVPTKAVNDRLLEALGCQSAVHLYQSYLNIGLVADAVVNKTCKPLDGSKMLTTVAGLIDVVDKQLEELNKLELLPEEKQGVQRIRAISSLIRVQLASLQAYWLSGDSRHAERYTKTREQAWSEISELLNL